MTAAARKAAKDAEASGKVDAAEQHLRQGMTQAPGDGDTIFALAEFLVRHGRWAEADPLYQKLLQAAPAHPAALNGIAIVKLKTGRQEEALDLWRQVAALRPKLAAPLVNIGLALRDAGKAQEAVALFEQALVREPDNAEIHYNLGVTLHHARHAEAAIAQFEAALSAKPDHARATVMLAQACQAICDWDRLDRLWPALRREIGNAVAGKPCAVSPRFAMLLPLSRVERKGIALVASQRYVRAAGTPPFMHRPVKKDRLTLGYFGADFREHPGLQLTAGLYRRHDRSRFQVNAYPVNRLDAYATGILNDGCDSVVELAPLSYAAAAQRIHDDGVDILIDISGFTTQTRPEILALRPAPLQLSWLGFAGTLSNQLYDYLIGDSVVTPPEHASDYLEAIVRLPHSYQINDCDQPIGNRPSRADEKLPPTGFVFACFSAPEKIERDVFARWMNILRASPGSVLWLFADAFAVQENLRRAADSHGIDAVRLVFAGRRSKAEHLGRMQLADLHLDTGTYGAHTTGSDALWAGVPLITMRGDAFPACVGASMLLAIGLPDLIASDWDSYERLAIDLARQPEKLTALREILAKNRLQMPLFDTARTVRDLEALYENMWRGRVDGKPPSPIIA